MSKNSLTKTSLGVMLLLLSSSISMAQLKTFKWTTELCEFSGTYDPAKITEQQLKDTYELWFNSASLQTDATVWKPEEVEKLSLSALQKEYDALSAKIKGLTLVKTPYWEKLRQNKLKEIDECYQLKAVTIKAYQHPEELTNYPAVADCKKYAVALIAGGDVMLSAWKEMEENQCQNNASPQNCIDRFMAMYTSSQKMQYAQIRLMAFGWWNCNNQQIPYVSRDEKMEEAFKKLFKNVKFTCDEP